MEVIAGAQPTIHGHAVRRMLAVLAADVVEYTRLTEISEIETHVRLRRLRVETIDPCVVSYRGRIIKNTGDGFLATFDSTIDAIRCAVDIQRQVCASEAPVSADRRIWLRIGLNVGETIVERDDIYGTSVNVAVRLEQFSPPGGIVVTDAVYARMKTYRDVSVDDIGELELKNLSRPIHAFSLRVASANGAAETAGHAVRRAKVPMIAVLPFRTVGDTSQDAYFGEGIIDDIIFALTNIRGLLVISRTSALTYRSGPIDLAQVGQELGVRYVLSGSVRLADHRLRIGVELASVEDGSLIWADRYDGDLADLFDLQERIATRVVWSLAPHVREAELRAAQRKRPENMNAYDLLMHAIDRLYRMHQPDFARAGELLDQAVAADDSYATAYAYAALWQIHNINQGWTTNLEADSMEAARLAAAAVERDPADGFAMSVHGHCKGVLFRDYDGALELFDRALEAAPGNAMAWTLSSGVYSYTGRTKQAIERAEMGLRLSPVDIQSYFYLLFLGLAHYVDGNYDEAIIWARKSAGLNPRLCSNLRWLIASLVACGKLEEARHSARTLLEVNPGFRLSNYASWCPLQPNLRQELIDRLRAAGTPD